MKNLTVEILDDITDIEAIINPNKLILLQIGNADSK
jgi:hypothetical protein